MVTSPINMLPSASTRSTTSPTRSVRCSVHIVSSLVSSFLVSSSTTTLSSLVSPRPSIPPYVCCPKAGHRAPMARGGPLWLPHTTCRACSRPHFVYLWILIAPSQHLRFFILIFLSPEFFVPSTNFWHDLPSLFTNESESLCPFGSGHGSAPPLGVSAPNKDQIRSFPAIFFRTSHRLRNHMLSCHLRLHCTRRLGIPPYLYVIPRAGCQQLSAGVRDKAMKVSFYSYAPTLLDAPLGV